MGDLPFGALKALDNMVIGDRRGGGLDRHHRAMRDDHRQRRLPSAMQGRDDPLCMDDPLPPPVVVDPTDPTSPVTPPIIIIGGGGGSGPVGAVGGVPETIDMANGTNWLWFFELVQAFRDVHGVRPYPPPDESLKREGPGSIECAGGGGPACLFSRTVLYGCGTDIR